MIENTARPYSNLCYTTVRFGIFSCAIPVFFSIFQHVESLLWLVLLCLWLLEMEIPVDIIIFLRFHKMLKM